MPGPTPTGRAATGRGGPADPGAGRRLGIRGGNNQSHGCDGALLKKESVLIRPAARNSRREEAQTSSTQFQDSRAFESCRNFITATFLNVRSSRGNEAHLNSDFRWSLVPLAATEKYS